MHIYNSIFTNNKGGGCISVSGTSNIYINNTKFEKVTSSDSVIYISNAASIINIWNTSFIENTRTNNDGGAIYIQAGSGTTFPTLHISNSKV